MNLSTCSVYVYLILIKNNALHLLYDESKKVLTAKEKKTLFVFWSV